MSYFLCLAIPVEFSALLPHAFDSRVLAMKATSFPIGSTAAGKSPGMDAFVLRIGSSSASLIGKAAPKRTRNNDHTRILSEGIENLIHTHRCPRLRFIAHWFTGYISAEDVSPRERRQIQLNDVARVVSELEEDVLYSVACVRDSHLEQDGS